MPCNSGHPGRRRKRNTSSEEGEREVWVATGSESEEEEFEEAGKVLTEEVINTLDLGGSAENREMDSTTEESAQGMSGENVNGHNSA